MALITVPFNTALTLRGGCEVQEEEKPADEPKGFDLDAWKRLYSNAAKTETILPEFWAKFDKEVCRTKQILNLSAFPEGGLFCSTGPSGFANTSTAATTPSGCRHPTSSAAGFRSNPTPRPRRAAPPQPNSPARAFRVRHRLEWRPPLTRGGADAAAAPGRDGGAQGGLRERARLRGGA